MGKMVVNGALLQCSFGNAPSSLGVLGPIVKAGGAFAANNMDNKPMANVKPFGMCSSMANPTVASATSAALGVLTPQPCLPVTSAPWTPGKPKVKVRKMPAVDDACTLNCNWGGVIQVKNAGQVIVTIK